MSVIDSHWLDSLGFLIKIDDEANSRENSVDSISPTYAKWSKRIKSITSKFNNFYYHEKEALTLRYRICNHQNSPVIIDTLTCNHNRCKCDKATKLHSIFLHVYLQNTSVSIQKQSIQP